MSQPCQYWVKALQQREKVEEDRYFAQRDQELIRELREQVNRDEPAKNSSTQR